MSIDVQTSIFGALGFLLFFAGERLYKQQITEQWTARKVVGLALEIVAMILLMDCVNVGEACYS